MPRSISKQEAGALGPRFDEALTLVRNEFDGLGGIAELAGVTGGLKFDVVAGLLRDSPDDVDLRIEDAGVRKGMWSVAQPQHVTVIRRQG